MRVKIAIGQIWKSPEGYTYQICDLSYGIASVFRIINRSIYGSKLTFRELDSERFVSHDSYFYQNWQLINMKLRPPRKAIPDIPLDPTLPILEAGYLQDRQRKRFRIEKSK